MWACPHRAGHGFNARKDWSSRFAGLGKIGCGSHLGGVFEAVRGHHAVIVIGRGDQHWRIGLVAFGGV